MEKVIACEKEQQVDNKNKLFRSKFLCSIKTFCELTVIQIV